MQPVYRMTVYEDDGVTVLTPRAGAPHSDQFKVATAAGVTGFQPYMLPPTGRRGRVDPLKLSADTGWLVVGLLDPAVSSTQAERWVTAFIGDALGENQLVGKPCLVEESTDGGGSWSNFFTGRIQRPGAPGRSVFTFQLRDRSEDQNTRIFTQNPRGVSYANPASLLPLGLPFQYGGHPQVQKLPGVIRDWSFTGRGSGKRLEIDDTLISGRDTDGIARVIVKDLKDRLVRPSDGEPHAGPVKHARIHLEWGANVGQAWPARFSDALVKGTVRGSAAQPTTGDFDPVQFEEDGAVFFLFRNIALAALDPADPDYVALPVDGTQVDFWISGYGRPSETAPLLLDYVHPVQLWKDILDGKFGPHDDTGQPLVTIPYDASAFSALIADTSIPQGRWSIEGPEKMNDWVEDNILLPYGLTWRVDADNQVVPVDMRMPTAIPGTTIVEADLAEDPPVWEQDRGGALAFASAEYYIDRITPPSDVMGAGGGFPDIVPTRLEESRLLVQVQVGRIDVTDAEFQFKASGYRAADRVLQKLFDQTQEVYVPRQLQKRLDGLRSPFGQGPATISAVFVRTANVTGCFPGDLRVLDISIPNAASVQRTGQRVVRCVGRQEDGPRLRLEFLDLGASLVAVTPTLGTLRLTTGSTLHDAEVDVTRNASGDDVVLEYAVTSTAVGTRPGATDAAWTFAQRVTADGFAPIGSLPSDRRIWVRGRSEGAPNQAKIPSAWVFPTPGSVDTAALSAPTGFSVSPSGCSAAAGWTNTEAAETIELLLDGVTYDILPPGVAQRVFEGLVTSTQYVFGVRYIDGFGGTSPLVTDTQTTSGTPDTAPDGLGVGILAGIPQ